MPLRGTGLLAIWNDIAPEHEADFEAWYRSEHLAERVGLAGFLRGRRYRAVDAPDAPRFGALYETETPEVLASDAYLARLDDPTPMTARNIARFRNTRRTVLRVVASAGRGVGGVLIVARPAPRAGTADAFAAASEELATALAAAPGVVGAHLARAEARLTTADNAEGRARGTPDRLDDWLLLVEATDAAPARTALAAALQTAAETGLADPGPPLAAYAMIHALAARDL